MLEKWDRTLDKAENFCTIFIDLSKAFDTINHELFLSRLKAYAFSENALKLMCNYLKSRRQAVQVNNNFSSYKKVQVGVLLLNLFVNDLLLSLSETFFK